jgi:hypothetical protein
MISVKKVLIQDKLFKNILNVEKDGNWCQNVLSLQNILK